MTFHKQIVCLANSRKLGGRCVAGKELHGDEEICAWVRPVSKGETDELLFHNMRFENGELPKPLDIITVPLIKHNPRTYQTENYLIDDSQCWVKNGKLQSSNLSKLCDPVDLLWINGYHSSNGYNDRVPQVKAERILSSSLLFVKPDILSILVKDEFNKRKVRAKFSFKEKAYLLAVTDPVIENKYQRRNVGTYHFGEPIPYLCVSIGEPYDNYCYKLVATIITP